MMFAAPFALLLLSASPAERPAGIPDWHSAAARGGPGEGEFMEGYADCVVHGWAEPAQELLATLPESSEQAAAADRLEAAGQCLHSGSVRMYAFELRGAIAEMLMRRGRLPARFTPPFPPGESYESFTARLLAPRGGRPVKPVTREIMLFRWFGYCGVERNRAGVEALMATKVHSKQEVDALDRLSATLAQCSPSRELRATVPQMRALLAEPLFWRRAAGGAPDG
jgi:hypothetical protein